MITAEQKVNILCGGIYTALHQLGTHLDSAASQSAAAEQHLLRTIYLTLRGALHAAGEPLPEDRGQAKTKSPAVPGNTAVELPKSRMVATTREWWQRHGQKMSWICGTRHEHQAMVAKVILKDNQPGEEKKNGEVNSENQGCRCSLVCE